MDNNIMISIKTLQTSGGESLEPVELQTPGKFGILNHKYYIRYEESELTGFPDTITTLKIWPGNVVVSRKGRFHMQLHYETGCQKLCLYPTPYGELGVSIYTSAIEYDFSEDGGQLQVDYTLDADNQNYIENSLRVSIRAI